MTKREFWLKLFQENDTALASAIHFCERFVNEEQLQNGAEFIEEKRSELNSTVPEEQVLEVFGINKDHGIGMDFESFPRPMMMIGRFADRKEFVVCGYSKVDCMTPLIVLQEKHGKLEWHSSLLEKAIEIKGSKAKE